MQLTNKIFKAIFTGLLDTIVLVTFTLGHTSSDLYSNNANSSTGTTSLSSEPETNITFTTIGSSFSPIITVTGNPEIKWVFGDNSTSDSASPSVNDDSDGGVTPGPGTIEKLKQQNVIVVTGLGNVAPYIQVWALTGNPVNELDFSDFTKLHT